MAYTGFQTGVSGGVIKDLAPQDLDLNSYSTIHNMRMVNNRLVPVKGYSSVFEPLPDSSPLYTFSIIRQGVPTVFMCSETGIYKYSNNLWTEVSRTVGGDYNSTLSWNHGVLNGCLFANNGSDILQVLEDGDLTFKDSANFPPLVRAKVFRPFKDYLFALNLTSASTTLRWSDPALAGAEPPSWDTTDPTTQAGEITLADTDGELVDAEELGNSFIIYKTDAVYTCKYIGGVFIFSFQKLFSNRGALNTGCISSFENKHFVVGYNDLYIHDGLKAVSVSEGRVRDYFYKDLNTDYLSSVFTYTNYQDKEIWVCYPNGSSTGPCNTALVWDWVQDVWTERDLPNVTHISNASVETGVEDVWDLGFDDTWDLGGKHWNATNFSPIELAPLMTTQDDSGKLFEVSSLATIDDQPILYTLEKLSTDYGNPEQIKAFHYMTPDIEGTGVLTIRQGGQNRLGDSVAWKTPSYFPVGDYRVHGRGTARYFSLRVEGSTALCIPEFSGFTIYISPEGEK